ncbi:carbonic anhydrase (plasmid) [Persicobacter psychrovividus]|uniref:Carbonic anhydrase n=2 Tax=Persicobacter psychrovividus TaxID=387638 RepID=A0ABM7VHN2_9BACT|nr:carbonic anhydrase [Persicobacter psychrovividus]
MKSLLPWLICGVLSTVLVLDHLGTSKENTPPHDKPDCTYLAEEASGAQQSPINIKTASIGTTKGHQWHVNYKKSHEKIVNTGHTIRLDYDSGSVLEYDEQLFRLRQFHFHTPSEHLIDGVTYPMEAHFVHTAINNDTTYLVVGILFKEGMENQFLKKFITQIPSNEGQQEIWSDFVNAEEVIKESEHYYCYDGSLTTPPYSETVKWFVMQNIQEASELQIEKINLLEGNNARHIQKINDRFVEGI